jgi:hypothetical protein
MPEVGEEADITCGGEPIVKPERSRECGDSSINE